MNRMRHNLAGTGNVFWFTLTQMMKNKSNLISLVIMVLFAIASVPMMVFFSGEEVSFQEGHIDTVYYWNETDYPISFEAIRTMDPAFADLTIQQSTFSGEDALENGELLGEGEVLIHLYLDRTDGFYHVRLILPEMEEEGDVHARLSDAVSSLWEEARLLAAGASREQLEIAMGPYQGQTLTVSEFLEETSAGWEAQFAIQYGYAIVVMILLMMSASYIISAIIEEKASKLVELLLVSVQPLALVVGKILAVMVFVFGMLISMALGFAASYAVTGLFADSSVVFQSIEQMGLTSEQFQLNPLAALIAVLFLLLGYGTFSVIAGIVGACCSSMDDMESANMSVVMLVMAGYLAASIVTAAESKTVAVVTSLIPILAIYCAPVQYVCGNVNLAVICISWILQAVVLLALFLLCAKVYRSLIMHKGSRLKQKELLALIFAAWRKEREA